MKFEVVNIQHIHNYSINKVNFLENNEKNS
jgi:hypothetical protein